MTALQPQVTCKETFPGQTSTPLPARTAVSNGLRPPPGALRHHGGQCGFDAQSSMAPGMVAIAGLSAEMTSWSGSASSVSQ